MLRPWQHRIDHVSGVGRSNPFSNHLDRCKFSGACICLQTRDRQKISWRELRATVAKTAHGELVDADPASPAIPAARVSLKQRLHPTTTQRRIACWASDPCTATGLICPSAAKPAPPRWRLWGRAGLGRRGADETMGHRTLRSCARLASPERPHGLDLGASLLPCHPDNG